MDNRQKTIDYINTIMELGSEEKNEFLKRVQDGDDIATTLDDIENKLQDKMDVIFTEAGVELDEKDPEYAQKHKEMMDEIQVAGDEFNVEMENIQKEAEELRVNTGNEIDQLKIEDLQNKLQNL
jgi:hypothetical protein